MERLTPFLPCVEKRAHRDARSREIVIAACFGVPCCVLNFRRDLSRFCFCDLFLLSGKNERDRTRSEQLQIARRSSRFRTVVDAIRGIFRRSRKRRCYECLSVETKRQQRWGTYQVCKRKAREERITTLSSFPEDAAWMHPMVLKSPSLSPPPSISDINTRI